MSKIIKNRIKCLLCGDIIESKTRHDMKYCSCGNCYVDGGLDYLRRGFHGKNTEDCFEDISIVEED